MSQFEWDDLRVFLALLRGRSVRAAAKIMQVSHSTVSRRLQTMEQQLGAKLFVRQNEGLQLTKIGEALIARAEKVESEILSMQREVFGQSTALSGTIRITAIPHIVQHLLIPCIAEFTQQYPEIDIQVNASYEMVNLSRHDADIAVRVQNQPDEHLVGHQLPDIASAVYATPNYIDTHNFTGDQASAAWIGWIPNPREMNKWHNQTPFSACKVKHAIYEPSAHLQAVKSELGFSYLFCFIGDVDGELKRIPDQGDIRQSPAWILTHPDLFITERVRVFAKFMHQYFWAKQTLLSGI
ncbi:LysR family transcriptional regulator [Vibrio tubiashii]|uniref:LysR family transcriptional regulator n=1 Tax=Vibrio tubiashii TaxID=29498 RepID=A0AAE5GPS0_9VIBR|nr:LysR family transcriptional regulator [Vibrio tubiashii]NOI80740.1 LysR family transcriptional regulator [Vibrio tubiashii]